MHSGGVEIRLKCCTHFTSYSLRRAVKFSSRLFGGSQTDSVVAQVVDVVVSAQESITEDSKRADLGWHIETHDGADAGVLNLQGVVSWSDGEVGTGEVEGEVWKRVDLFAWDGVLAVPTLGGSHLSVQELSVVGWESDQRGTGIEDGTGGLEFGGILTKGERSEFDLPVGLSAKRDPSDITGVVLGVDSTENDLGLTLGTSEVEGEN